jgi:uncharacterized 2Fe-2S/4Fe-4S cluster protein (DUF4445 family)
LPNVVFHPRKVALDVESGVTLLDAARRAGLEIESPCNGLGTCKKCRVKVDQPHSVHHRNGEGAFEVIDEVLACTTEVGLSDLLVTVPEQVRGRDRVLLSGHRVARPINPWVRREWQADKEISRIFYGDELLWEEPGMVPVLGLAVDIGTTTLVVSLLDLQEGRELGTVGALNPQARLGHDVLTRIQLASDEAGLTQLHELLSSELRRMTEEVTRRAGVTASGVREIVLSGNTTMLHLAANVIPRSLGRYPYTPVIRGDVALAAADLGLLGAPRARVYLPPILDGFVGADITAGVLSTGLKDLSGVTLFIDVGTNGEMVLARDGRLIGTSTAAGPAFEGMNITFGMRGMVGAIEKVRISLEGIETKTIGGVKALGICGSGLVDAVSEMVRTGIVSASGRFALPSALPKILSERLVRYEGKPAISLFRSDIEGEPDIVLTQQDVRQVQLAKGAVRAGIEALLAHEGLTPAMVDRVLLAGSFGAHLQPASLVGIGLLPEALGERVTAVGNTSRTGAEALLLDREARAELVATIQGATAIDLAHAPAFEKTFVNALAFPKQERAAA